MEYNIIDDMKKTRANITLYELRKLKHQQKIMMKELHVVPIASLPTAVASHNMGRPPTNVINKIDPNDIALIGGRSRSHTPPFLLTYEIFNKNVHNCLVDSGASTNILPRSIRAKLNVQPQKFAVRIVQLDRSQVEVIGELNQVTIRFSSNPKVCQVIDILVADIPEFYGLILSMDWSEKLHGYFSTDWSHMWLPYNGKPNQIKVERELHQKYIVTELEGENEAVAYNSSIIGNYSVDSFLVNFNAHTSPYLENLVLSQVENFSQTDNSKCVNFVDKPVNTSLFWKLYFDGSKSKEGAGAGCVLISPEGDKTMRTCRLEFDCTNNTAEYEALVQGLYKAIGLNVKYLQVFGDSEIVVKQVRNTIHCLSGHLKHYQSLVQYLTEHFIAFDISSIPRLQNASADLLANIASKLIPSEDFSPDRFSIELIFRPSIPDNITNWKVFNDDPNIVNFLTSKGSYSNQIIDKDHHDRKIQQNSTDNAIPKSVVKLEDLYDLKNRFKRSTNSKLYSPTLNYELVNLGTDDKPQNVNLGIGPAPEEKLVYIRLLRQYKNVFAWNYNELKTYDTLSFSTPSL